MSTHPYSPISHLLSQAISLHQSGDLTAAIPLYQQIISAQPNHTQALNNLGVAYRTNHQHHQALDYFHQAINSSPSFYQAHNNLGNTYLSLNQLPPAIKAYRRAIKLHPNYSAPYINLGNIYRQLNHSKKALAWYQKALQHDPQSLNAYNNLGATYLSLHQYTQAITSLQQALSLDSNSASTHYNLGLAYQAAQQPQQAIHHFLQATQVDPHYSDAFSHLTFLHLRNCDWPALEQTVPSLLHTSLSLLQLQKRPGITPFIDLITSPDPLHNFLISQSWACFFANQVSSLKPQFKFRQSPPSKLTLAYLSANFNQHPVGYQIQDLFAHHDRSQFRIHCYSTHPNTDPVTANIRQSSDQFIDLSGIDYLQAAHLIRQHRTDILIDLMGHTQNHFLPTISTHPAPLQINYLGFTGTTGADYLDYIITDPTLTPPSQQPFYSEKFIFLPHSYLVSSTPQLHSPPTRSQLSLPSPAFIFTSFNKTLKIDPQLFATWMKLLHTIKSSLLWLFPTSSIDQQNLTFQAQKHGIDSSRLIFSPQTPLTHHLSRLQLADLGLDTVVYSGGASTAQALFTTLPLITLQGNTYISRMSTSILHNFGFDSLVTHSLDDYFHLAFHLATHPQKLSALRTKLTAHKARYPLFATPRFTNNLETAYLTAWHRYLKGQPPRSFQVIDPLPLHS